MKLKRALLAGSLVSSALGIAGCEQKRPPTPEGLKKIAARTAIGPVNTKLEARSQPSPPRAGEVSIWDLKVFNIHDTPDGTRDEWKFYNPLPQPAGSANTTDVLMNAWLVSRDGSVFLPARPSYKQYGSFVTDWTPPRPGDYTLFVEYQPDAEYKTEDKSKHYPIENAHWNFKVVAGTSGFKPLPKEPHWTPSLNPAPITLNGLPDGDPAGTLVFKDMPENANDIKTVIVEGAPGGSTAMEMAAVSSGGTLLHFQPYADGRSFKVVFPKSGLYKVWAYFSLNGALYAAPVTRWIS